MVLLRSFDKLARRLLASRNFDKPIKAMQRKVQELLSGTEMRDSLRYILQSEHDTHVINSVAWLEPLEDDYVDMPFASQLMMELHYNKTCIESIEKSTKCFTVEVYNNGSPLKFDTCMNSNKARGSSSPICQFDDFIAHIDKRKIKGDVI